MMKNRTVKPVRKDDFFDRRQEMAELWHLVERDNVLMLAPRRVGKTSILLRMRDLPREGWRCSFLNVEAVDSEAQFVARLLAELYRLDPQGTLWSKLGDRVLQVLRGIGKVGPVEVDLTRIVDRDWQEVGSSLLRLLGQLPGRNLLLLDEFPIFVRRLLRSEDGPARTRLLLDWFRMVRLDPAVEDADVHFLLAGSIGLDSVVARVGMTGTINDLVTFRLGPLSADKGDELLAELGKGEGLELDAGIRRRILSHIRWPIPYHLQLIVDQMLRQVRFRGATLSEDLVDRAYEALFAPENRKHFSHWEERLQDKLLEPAERDLMRAVLEAAARDPAGMDADTLVQLRNRVGQEVDARALLLALEHDGYLAETAGRWRFASSLLRDWWLRWQTQGV